jgi:diguanylate cyclase (GGDEF)-like protein
VDGGWQAVIRLVGLGVNCMSRSRAKGAKKAKPARGKRKRAPVARNKKTSTKTGLAATRLSDEINELKNELALARTRLAELETRVDEDPLTRLHNRRGFIKALERSLAYVRRYGGAAALVFLDLDGFKAVNDRYGHAAGDWVLWRVSQLIAGRVRASDVAGRVGGDEFVVLLWNLGAKQADLKARALEELIENSPFERSGKRYAIGISAGLTMLAANDTSETALARADQAMYARKKERRRGSH